MGVIAVLLVLAVGVAAAPGRAATTPDLSGEWINSAYELSAYQLHTSAGGKTLAATWGANIGSVQEGLVGSFTGTLNQSGTAFVGPMHVDAGSIRVGGKMTVTISSQRSFGAPLLTVSYQQDNGVQGAFTLEIWLVPRNVSPSARVLTTFAFDCPGPQPCHGKAEAQALGVGGSSNVGSVSFTIRPRGTRTITLALGTSGRALLAKRGSLRVRVRVVALNKSSNLPPLTNLGTVMIR
jgi:hypothetical protein